MTDLYHYIPLAINHAEMDDALPDLVRDWKLDSIVGDGFTLQTRHISNHSTGLWRTPVEERWERVKKLGQGGFGIVWLEQCSAGPSTGKVRAVKQLQAGGFGTQKVSFNMLSRELLAVMKFSHSQYRDCFVESFGWYDSPESIFITMEYIPLGDLEAYIKEPLPETQTQRISKQLLQGLAFMHKSNFAHRDLKPGNILVQHNGPDWWVKISDLGTSKQIKSTVLRTVVGTQFYQAPEVIGFYQLSETDFKDDPTYDLAVDIWAVGAIAFRLMTGRVAFPHGRDLFLYVVRNDPFPVDDIMNAQCTEFITQTMSGSPRQRPTAKQALESHWISVLHSDISYSSYKLRNGGNSIETSLEADKDASAQWSTPSNTIDATDSPSAVPTNKSNPSPLIVDESAFAKKEEQRVREAPASKTSTSNERSKKRESNRSQDKRETEKGRERRNKTEDRVYLTSREARGTEKKPSGKVLDKERRHKTEKRSTRPDTKPFEDRARSEKKRSGKKKSETQGIFSLATSYFKGKSAKKPRVSSETSSSSPPHTPQEPVTGSSYRVPLPTELSNNFNSVEYALSLIEAAKKAKEEPPRHPIVLPAPTPPPPPGWEFSRHRFYETRKVGQPYSRFVSQASEILMDTVEGNSPDVTKQCAEEL